MTQQDIQMNIRAKEKQQLNPSDPTTGTALASIDFSLSRKSDLLVCN